MQVAPIPVAVGEHAIALTTDGRALLCGGWDGTAASALCFIYDPMGSNGTWTMYVPMVTARRQHAMDICNGELPFAGQC